MPPVHRLANPPIREALLDVRAVPKDDLRVEQLLQAHEKIRSAYPHQDVIRTFESKISAKPDVPSSVKTGVLGYVFQSEDRTQLTQFRLDGFTLNRLRPYTSWELLLPEALRLWSLYATVARPEKIPRIAVRYINEFQVPDAQGARRLFASPPWVVTNAIGADIREHLSRVVSSVLLGLEPTAKVTAVVTHSFQRALSGADGKAVFDIDVFAEGDFESEALRKVFETLAEYKNRLFFENMTEDSLSALGG